jgi:hypothetical protein
MKEEKIIYILYEYTVYQHFILKINNYNKYIFSIIVIMKNI